MMKTLNLPLKAKWYDMIESGIKKEEYREIKDYWTKRICDGLNQGCQHCKEYHQVCKNNNNIPDDDKDPCQRFTHVKFSYGYTKRTMAFEIENITIGTGKTEWGAEKDKEYYVIKLGKRLV